MLCHQSRACRLLLATLAVASSLRTPQPPRSAAIARKAGGAAVLGLSLAAATPLACGAKELTSPQRLAAEAWRTTDKAFFDRTFNGLSWFEERGAAMKAAKDPESGREAVVALLKKLGDKYTRYVAPDDYAKLVAATLGDAAFVAGAGVTVVDAADGVLVVDVEPGAPADAGGLRPGDVLTAVDGLGNLEPATAIRALRGDAGSSVDVTYVRGKAAPAKTQLKRAVVQLSTVRGDGNVVRVRAFALDTADLVRAKVDATKGPLVLDLRGNGGGSLEGGIETAKLFLRAEAKVVDVIDQRGAPFGYVANEDGPYAGRQLTVLVDDKTASAAEVLTAALQDNGAATVVGANSDRTFGKGVIQTVLPLGDPPGNDGAVAVTVAKYSTPKGTDINGRGIGVDRTVACGLADKAAACAAK